MFLETTVTPYDDGMSIKDLYDNLKSALDQAMSPNKLIETLTSIENQAIKLQKSIGGVVDDTGHFNEQLFEAYRNTQKQRRLCNCWQNYLHRL